MKNPKTPLKGRKTSNQRQDPHQRKIKPHDIPRSVPTQIMVPHDADPALQDKAYIKKKKKIHT